MRVKTLFKRFFIFSLLAIIGIFIVLIVFGVESKPWVVSEKELSTQDVERAKQLVKQNDPRKLKAGEIKSLQLTERDLNLLLHYALSLFPYTKKLKAAIDLYPNSADTRFTFTLPDNPLGSYLNLSVTLSKSSDSLAIERLKIGALTFPGRFVNPMMQYAYRYLQRSEKYRGVTEVVQAVKDFRLQEDQLLLVYQWQPDMVNRLRAQGRDLLLSTADKERLLAYNEHLAKISYTLSGQSVSLTEYLR
ncbi:MAG: hypothetical protein L0Y56_01890, partial [Nitrospira sp.]|nr:hypothetical protein [Nitrospira sp.]